MVKRTISRSYRIEGDDYIAIKKEEVENGKGKHVANIMEEHNISMDEINDVLDTLVFKELEDVNEREAKYLNDIEDIVAEIEPYLEDPEYLEFLEYIKGDKIEKFFNIASRQKVLKSSESLLDEVKNKRRDVIAWEKQFKDLKQAIEDKM